jgi:hypothetical protein
MADCVKYYGDHGAAKLEKRAIIGVELLCDKTHRASTTGKSPSPQGFTPASIVDMEQRKSIQQIGSGVVLAVYLAAISFLAFPVAAAGPDGVVPLSAEPSEYGGGFGIDVDLDGEDKLSVASLFPGHSLHPGRCNHHGGPDSGPHRLFSRQQARGPPGYLS